MCAEGGFSYEKGFSYELDVLRLIDLDGEPLMIFSFTRNTLKDMDVLSSMNNK